MTQPVKNANGFTLLELILAMGIVGFIIAISLGAIRLGISTQEVGQKKTETYQRLRIIGEHLSQKSNPAIPSLFLRREFYLSPQKPSSANPNNCWLLKGIKLLSGL
jgi:prepilin-type N-terminal cleavage/methylation domain-containing protein